ncbi:MAG: hypothetical protein EHM21_08740, partial [Chloroflexi bacterium]
MIAFFNASFSLGTPDVDDFSRQVFNTNASVAPRPFFACLPQKMLSHPKGGALAVLGLVDNAWGYSLNWNKAGREFSVYESFIRRLAAGDPVGSAFEYFNQRYAELSTDLSSTLEEIKFGLNMDPLDLIGLWATSNDARNFSILGDPAVRLMVGEELEPKTRRVLELKKSVETVSPLIPEGQAATPTAPAADFITLLRSKNQQDIIRGVEGAIQAVNKSTEISARIQSREDEENLNPDEQNIIKATRQLQDEIAHFVTVIETGNRKDRESALFVLEKLGSIARPKAVPVLKELALKDPDESIRQLCVRAIVAVDNRENDLADELRSFLKGGTPLVRKEALDGINILKKLQKAYKSEIGRELLDLAGDESLGVQAVETLYGYQDQKLTFLTDVLDTIGKGKMEYAAARCAVGRLLLVEKQSLAEAWIGIENRDTSETRERIFQLLLGAVRAGTEEDQASAITWLAERIEDLHSELLDRMIKDFRSLWHLGEDTPVQRQMESLINTLQRLKRAERNKLQENLRSSDSPTVIEAIKQAAEREDEWAMRILIQEWVQWIAFGQSDKTQFVEEVAEKIRGNPLAVLPLVNWMGQEFQPSTDDLSRAVMAKPEKPKTQVVGVPAPATGQAAAVQPVASPAGNGSEAAGPAPVVKEKDETQAPAILTFRKELSDQIDIELHHLSSQESSIQQKILLRLLETPNIKNMNEDNRRKLILVCMKDEFNACGLKVHRRIARQLADMSNPYFFEEMGGVKRAQDGRASEGSSEISPDPSSRAGSQVDSKTVYQEIKANME